MIRSQQNSGVEFAPRACVELQELAKARDTAFAGYASARDHLSVCAEADGADHTTAVETFEAARTLQRKVEKQSPAEDVVPSSALQISFGGEPVS